MDKWELLSSKMAFDHRWYKVRQDTVKLPNGKILDDYFVGVYNNVSLVVPVTANNEFVMVRQYKHAASEILIEFPAGMIDLAEEPEQAAYREMEEETGYTSSELFFLGSIVDSPTKTVGKTFMYLARNVELTKAVKFDDNEDIEVLVLPYKDVLQMIINGEIKVSGTITAAFLVCKKLGLS